MTGYLNQLQDHLNNFNADTAEMIKGYWPKTGIKTNLIFVMMEIRDKLETTPDPKLNATLKTLRQDYSAYVGEKMRGEHDDKDDLLFEVREVAKLQLKIATKTVIQDIRRSTLSDPLKTNLISAFESEQYAKVLTLIEGQDT